MGSDKSKASKRNFIKRRLIVPLGMSGQNSLFLGQIGDWTWDAVYQLCSVNPYKAKNEKGNPSYLSFFYYHIKGNSKRHLHFFNIGEEIEVVSQLYSCNAESIYAVHKISLVSDASGGPAYSMDELYENPDEKALYVETFNRWVSRTQEDSNEELVKSSPIGFKHKHLPKLSKKYPPWNSYRSAINHHTFFQNSEKFKLLLNEELSKKEYKVNPARDINGVGLLYFATYFSISDQAIWQSWQQLGGKSQSFLNRKVVAQKICYLGNADANTKLETCVKVWQNPDKSAEYVFNVIISKEKEQKVIAITTLNMLLEETHFSAEFVEKEKLPIVIEPFTKKAYDKQTPDTKIVQILCNELAQILNLNSEKIEPNRSFSAYGLNSVSVVEYIENIVARFQLENREDIEFNPSTFFGFKNVETLALFLTEKLTFTKDKLEFNETSKVKVVYEKKIQTLEKKEKLAIIGIAGVFPGAENYRDFWRNLVEKKSLISDIPKERVELYNYLEQCRKEQTKGFPAKGGFIDHVDKFDAPFFNISPKEAELMDPQQRILLQTVWHSIEDAGYNPYRLSNKKIGLFVGVSGQDYLDLLTKQKKEIDAHVSTGNSHSILANRISYLLNFSGPSEAIDTACSSSLVAVHHAAHALASGDCELAIASGVNLLISPTLFASYYNAGMLSEDGLCKTFDQSANGYVRGEGCGVVFLKPLPKAIKDNDPIYGTILGSAVNHGGHTTSLTAPNPNAQAELIVKAYESAEVSIDTVSYIETHGTGTQLGDPIEINGLKQAMKNLALKQGIQELPKNYCGLSSVKTNIGHLEAAAGIAGLIKVLLAFTHKKIPALNNFKKQNPYINLQNTPFYLVEKTKTWETIKNSKGKEELRRAGVSSFGFGGANAHVVLEEYISSAGTVDNNQEELILLSAKNEESLKEYAKNLEVYLKENEDSLLRDIAYTLQVGREPQEYRLAILVSTTKELKEKLKSFLANQEEIDNCYFGNVKNKNATLNSLKIFFNQDFEKNEWLESLIQQSIKKKKLKKLAEIWVNGIDITFQKFFQIQGKRISLPTYPFEKISYWIEKSIQKSKKENTLHPLIHQNTSTIEEQRFASIFSGEEFFLKEHLVLGKKTLPAVCYLEMVREASQLSGLEKVSAFKNVVWLFPFQIENKEKKLHLELYPESETETAFEFYSENETNNNVEGSENKRTIYCQGLIDSKSEKKDRSKVDLKIVKEGLKEKEVAILYNDFSKLGLGYGESFRTIKQLYQGKEECLAYISLAEHQKEERYGFHPALLDGILQASVFLAGFDELSIPFTLKHFQIYNEFTDSAYVHVRKTLGTTLELKIYSLSGQLLAELNEFIVASIRKLEKPSKIAEKTVAFSKDESENISKIEEKLVAIASSVLKLKKRDLSPTEKLSKYGLDSVSFTSLSNSLNKNLGLSLSPALFFEHQTLSSFAQFLSSEYANEMSLLLERKNNFKNVSPLPKYTSITSIKRKFSKGSSRVSSEDVAIIGMSGAFGNATNLDELWQNLVEGKDSVSEIPLERWNWRDYYGDPKKESDKTSIKEASFLKDIDKFDAKFFNISPVEAELMDPQQRILIEHVWKAIEDSGISAKSLSGSDTALFIGCMNDDYKEILNNNNRLEPQTGTGLHPSILTNRISYYFNFNGASEPINTACSSSLVALHRAMQVLREEKSGIVIAGGVNAILSPTPFIVHQHAGMLAEDGRSKTYSKNANGYGRGEGVGVVALKLLSKAIADGDRIHAVLKGSAVNHGGHVSGITVPNPVAQEKLLKESYADAEIDFSTVTYFENHGTGTSLGDPIEINGLKKAFGKQERHYYCTIGSVKSNIGHTEGAAGIAGVFKTVLAMKHKIIPKTLHVDKETLNPYIELENSPFQIAYKTSKWEKLDKNIPRRAGVSSFGFGGANAHVVLEEYERTAEELKKENATGIIPLFVLSAKSKETLKEYVKTHLDYFEESSELFGGPHYLYTLQTGRDIFEHKLAIYFNDKMELFARLNKFLKDKKDPNIFYSEFSKRKVKQSLHGEKKEELLSKLFLKAKNYQEFAKLWISLNSSLNFKKLYKPNTFQKISLPRYPFEKIPYWIEKSIQKSKKENTLHPLIHQNTSTIEEQRFASIFSGEEFFLKKHLGFKPNIVQKISLPKYPFDKTPYWIEKPIQKSKAENTLHPLIHQNTSTMEGQRFFSIFSGEEFFPKKHLGFKPNTVQKISLPKYPFEKIPYWIEKSIQKSKKENTLHPLIHQNTSTIEEQRFASIFSGEEFFLKEHLVLGKKTLPAVCYLEMVREASQLSGLEKVSAFKNVVWLFPFQIKNKEKKLHLELYPESETETVFEFYSENETNNNLEGSENKRTIYCQGLIDSKSEKKDRSKVDLKIVKEGLKEKEVAILYNDFSKLGLGYGESFRTIKQLYKGKEECLAYISLAEHQKEERYGFHPALLDGILQASVFLAGFDELSIPFTLKHFQIYNEFTDSAYVHVRKTLGTTLELKIYSLSGQLLAELNEFIVASIRKLEKPSKIAEKTVAFSKDESENISKIEEKLVAIASSVLKLKKRDLSPTEKLSKYGLDSVSFTSLSNSLNKNLGLSLSPALFFEHQTLSSFAQFLSSEYANEMSLLLERKNNFKNVSPLPKYTSITSIKRKFSKGSSRVSSEDVAIIGMSGAFGNATNLDELWQNLVEGKDSVSEIPLERWNWRDYYGDPKKESDKTSIKEASFLKDIDKFDAKFFNISPVEAELMDPQQRILIEHVWKAIEDSGISAKSLSGSDTALFIGCMNEDYKEILNNKNRLEPQVATGLHSSILTNRISYFFDFHGASEPINTACSSSLVALHRAIKVLREGESEIAIAGGVNAILTPNPFIICQHAGMLAEDGRSKTYSKNANGYGRGEGVGVVALKLLSKAIADGDRIHAVLKGSAVNHGGHVSGITVPNPVAQEKLLKESYADAEIDFSTVTYFENHGTGTSLGDPIEINGLKKAFGKQERHYYCTIGSVKSNIGHTEGAAGIAGVLKTVLAMKHKIIPKTLHVDKETLNPYIELENSPFQIAYKTSKWEKLDKNIPRRAGVSSFGFGGANAHVVLEEYESVIENQKNEIIPVFVLSAKSKESLVEYVKSHLQYAQGNAKDFGLTNYFHMLQTGRAFFEYRLAIYVKDKFSLIAKLTNFLKEKSDPNLYFHKQQLYSFHENPNIELLGKLYLKTQNYQEFAKLWSQYGFEFSSFYRQKHCKKISIPTYPFKKEKFWVERKTLATQKIKQHPLFKINELLNQKFTQKNSYQNRIWKKIPVPTYPFEKNSYWVEKSNKSSTLSNTLHPLIHQNTSTTKKAVFEELLKKIQEELTLPVYHLSNKKFKSRLSALADLYLKEYNIHFEKLSTKQFISKISLPTYPFKKEKLWITTSNNRSSDFLITNENNTPLNSNEQEIFHPLISKYIPLVENKLNKNLPFRNKKLSKLSLPTYPFVKEKYWVEKNIDSSLIGKEHPLIHKNTSTLEEQRFTSVFTGKEFFLRDHIINGKIILPAVCYLEMIRAAAEKLTSQDVLKIQQIVWLAPIIIEEEKQEFYTSIFYDEEGNSCYEIYSIRNENETVIHSQGFLELGQRNIGKTPEKLKIDLSDYQEVVSKEELYRYFHQVGLTIKESFWTVNKLLSNGEQGYGIVALEEERKGELEGFYLHPSLLDGILQTCFSVVNQEKYGDSFKAPFSIKEVELFGKLEEENYVSITKVASKNATIEKFNLVVFAKEGKVLLKISEFFTRRIDGQEEIENKRILEVVPAQKTKADDFATKYLLEEASKILKLDKKKLNPNENLSKFGFESLSINKLTNEINKKFKLKLTPALFFEHTTLASFSKYLQEEYGEKLQKVLKSELNLENPKLKIVAHQEETSKIFRKNKVRDFSSRRAIGTPFALDAKREDIAVIGMDCRLPGSKTYQEFWNHLCNGENLISEIPLERWDWKEYYGDPQKEENKTFSKWGGFIEGISQFEPFFFNISGKEAELMDPQQRLLLESTWKTIEDAGYDPKNLMNSKTGVYIGVSTSDYAQLIYTENSEAYANSGNAHSIVPNRLSYYFGFTGPSEPIDTACSSSLIALHRAVQSIKNGECEQAIVGGVNAILTPPVHLSFSKAGMLANDGKCKTFSKEANGYVRGEGGGTLLLKPLSTAQADRDSIYAVIKGTATNHGGHVSSLTVPNPNAQAALIQMALENAKVGSESISYIECHGTGTSLGDPIEINGLKKAFGKENSNAYCTIGSVKSNIGHLEAGAGVAGMIKTILAMKHKIIPKTLHVSKANVNPFIELEESPFKIAFETKAWKKLDKNIPRRAGVSSFGFGGANAHVILEEYEANDKEIEETEIVLPVLVLSAKSKESLDEYVKSHVEFAEEKPDLFGTASYFNTLQRGRTSFGHRLAIYAKDKMALLVRLNKYLQGKKDSNIFYQQEQIFTLSEEAKAKAVLMAKLFIKVQNYRALAKLWITNCFDFKGLGIYNFGQKISLPTYPFKRQKYWIESSHLLSPRLKEQVNLHPLLDENVSNLKEQQFKKTFTGREFYLRDHLVQGHKILPGVAYLEMVRAAATLADQSTPISKLKNIVWAKPIESNGKPEEVYISLSPNGTSVNYEIRTQNKSETTIHSQGKIVYQNGIPKEIFKPLDLNKIEKRTFSSTSPNELYQGFAARGLNYGPTFQPLQWIKTNKKEALGKLILPELLNGESNGFQLHPSLMDGALQTIAGLEFNKESNELALPFGLEELLFFKEIPQECYAYVEQESSHGTIKKYNVSLTNSLGEILVQLRGFSVRKLQLSKKAISSTILPKDETVSYYKSIWRESKLVVHDKISEKQLNTVMLFGNNKLQAEEIKNSLKEKKHSLTQIIQVREGESYQEINASLYQINLADPKDYQKLLQKLKDKGFTLTHFVLLDMEKSLNDLRLENNALRIFELTKALMSLKIKEEVKLIYFYPYHENSVAYEPMNAGFMKSLRLEKPKYKFKTIGLAPEYQSAKALREILLEEFEENFDSVEIRYSKQKRWIKQFEEVSTTKKTYQVKKGSSILITGGLGGLGFIFARHLASTAKANLILLGRSKLSQEKEEQLDKLKKLGSEVLYVEADICKKEELQETISKVKAKFGEINGVIHSAGVIRDNFLLKKTREEFQKVLAPKVLGTLNLDEATKEDPLDFFVLFSSISSILGNLGQSDYATGNAFLDCFAENRNLQVKKKQRFGKTVSINWPLWESGGMQVNEQTKAWLKNSTGMVPLRTESGIKAFDSIFGLDENQVIVVSGEQEKIRHTFKISEKRQEKKENNHSQTSLKGLEEKTIQELQNLCSELLKVEKEDLDIEVDLSEFGVDSIQMMNLLNKLETLYEQTLSPNVIAEYPTIKGLAKFLVEEGIATNEKNFSNDVYADNELEDDKVESIEVIDNSTNYRLMKPVSFIPMKSQTGKIAVIGLSCRFPGSSGPQAYWENLKTGKNLITEVPQNRWDPNLYFSKEKTSPNKSYSKWGGFLSDIDCFDASFFGISEQEAISIDPQHRILLELTQHLFDHAGYTKKELNNKHIGVYIGGSEGHYLRENYKLLTEKQNQHMVVNSIQNMMAARISDFYNLKGPSKTIDTACSSSLVAIHDACQAIIHGEVEGAIAGGVKLLFDEMPFIGFSKAKVLSDEEKSYIFDERAKGIILGEGAGLVLLKPYEKAIEDGDQIFGVILGSAVNNDGHTMGLTIPNLEAQKEVIQMALDKSEVTPDTISYLEAHGTGTLLGDPIEIKAATQIYQVATKKKQYCAVGSVKSNMGHLLHAAGVASFIKTILALQNKMLPATLHCEKPHPRFKFENSAFYPITETKPWIREDDMYRAGISSFGFGGTNCHIILENGHAGTARIGTARRAGTRSKFNRKRYWVGKKFKENENFTRSFSYNEALLKGHLIFNEQVLMGVTHCSLAIEAAKQQFPNKNLTALSKVSFLDAIKVNAGNLVKVGVEFKEENSGYSFVNSYSQSDNETLKTTATGKILFEEEVKETTGFLEIGKVREEAKEVISSEIFYKSEDQETYNSDFFTVKEIYKLGDTFVGKAGLSEIFLAEKELYGYHPAIFDAAYIMTLFAVGFDLGDTPWVPLFIKKIKLVQEVSSEGFYCETKLLKKNSELIVTNTAVYNRDGSLALVLEGFSIKKISSPAAFGVENIQANSSVAKVTKVENPQFQLKTLEKKARTSPQNTMGLRDEIENYIVKEIQLLIGNSSSEVSLTKNFMDLGIDSNELIGISKTMEEDIGIELYPTLFFEYQNIKDLATYFVEDFSQEFSSYLDLSSEILSPEKVEVASLQLKKSEVKSVSSLESGEPEEENVISEIATPKSLEFIERSRPLGYRNDDIAIIGKAGRVAGFNNLDDYWEALAAGKDLITEIPKDHWDYRPWFDEDQEAPNKTYSKWGSFLKDIDKFDPGFFQISEEEATWMDPQLRQLLEVTYETAEDAGIVSKFSGSNTGVYVGVCFQEYWDEIVRAHIPLTGYESMSSAMSSYSGRVSYTFDLQGGSIPLDNACASSLTAIHLACQALRLGEIEMGLVAGINTLLSPLHYVYFSRMKAFSPTGRCNSFDKAGNGYVPGEGIFSLLLKPLEKAIEDRDNIQAVIKGTAINHVGRANNPAAPRPELQTKLILKTWEKANIEPESISYLEAHGTGTLLGDSIEFNALQKAFKKHTDKKQFCALGSAKASIGHLEAAAGIGGVIKLLLQMQHKKIPKMPNFKELNPYINLEKSPFYINQELQEWETETGVPRRAGVSSFGMTGNNAHLILEEYQVEFVAEIDNFEKDIILLSAKSEDQLRDNIVALKIYLKKKENKLLLRDVAYTLRVGREVMEHRLAIIATDIKDLIKQLENFIGNKETLEASLFQGREDSNNVLVKSIINDEDASEMIEQWLEKKKLKKLAEFWVTGVSIDWSKLGESGGRKVSLPTYCFAKERYWFPQGKENKVVQTKPTSPEVKSKVGKIRKSYEKKSFSETMIIPFELDGQEPLKSLQQYLVQIVSEIMGLKKGKLGVDTDLMKGGLSSIQFIELTQKLKEGLRLDLSPALFFDYNTIMSFSQYLLEEHFSESNKRIIGGQQKLLKPLPKPKIDFENEAKLELSLFSEKKIKGHFNTKPKGILITGVTGYVGAYLVSELIEKSEATLYCLIRGKSKKEGLGRLRANLQKYGIWKKGNEKRIKIITGDFSANHFGLKVKEYKALSEEIDSLYHCGAWVNFVLPYKHLKEANVEGTREIIAFAFHQKVKTLHYISTENVFEGIHQEGKIFEEHLLAKSCQALSGYGQTKWVAERLVSQAKEAGLPVVIYRPAGIAQAVSPVSVLNESDTLTLVLLSCIQMKKFPQMEMFVDSSPVDYVAQSIVSLSLSSKSKGKVFHLSHPEPVPLHKFQEIIHDCGQEVELMSYSQWVNEVEIYSKEVNHQFLQLLLPIFNSPITNEGESWFEFATNRPEFDCTNTLKGLKPAGIDCPEIGKRLILATLFKAYLSNEYLKLKGVVSESLSHNFFSNKKKAQGIILTWTLFEQDSAKVVAKNLLKEDIKVEVFDLKDILELAKKITKLLWKLKDEAAKEYAEFLTEIHNPKLADNEQFKAVLAKIFETILIQYQPEFVISMCPWAARIAEFCPKEMEDIPLFVLVEEQFGKTEMWISKAASLIYFLSNEQKQYFNETLDMFFVDAVDKEKICTKVKGSLLHFGALIQEKLLLTVGKHQKSSKQ